MIPKLSDFFEMVDKSLQEKGFALEDHWLIDHICLRTSTIEEYKRVCSEYSVENELLIESHVGGRLISTFKLLEPLLFNGYEIPLIEIPEPKLGRQTASGYEHLEIVVTESFDALEAKFQGLNILKHALSKKINPELEVEFDNFSLKFHHQSLQEVIEYEKSLV